MCAPAVARDGDKKTRFKSDDDDDDDDAALEIRIISSEKRASNELLADVSVCVCALRATIATCASCRVKRSEAPHQPSATLLI